MKTVKYLSFVFFLLFPAVLPAQSAKQQAQSLFSQAKYNEAASLCYGAAAMESQEKQKDLFALAKKCEKCIGLLKTANVLYSQNNFKEASAVFKKVLDINPSDSAAKSRLNSCNKYLSEAADKKEKQQWETAVAINTIEAYTDYINNNPESRHVEEAQRIIEDKLWQNVIDANSIKAFEDYLDRTKTDAHVIEAKKKLAEMKDEAAWKDARDTGTRRAYQSYVDNVDNIRYRNQAVSMIAKYDADSLYLNKDYENAAKKYSFAEIYLELSDDDIKCYRHSLEESHYAQIIKGANISLCQDFLEKWPGSVYKWKVKDRLARLYADSGRFGDAKRYAIYRKTVKYVKSAKKNAKKRQRKK